MARPLESLEPLVRKSREAYRRSLRDLPHELRSVAELHLDARLARAAPQPLLGEFAPWLVADILGITSVPAVQRLTTAWLHVYFFSLIVDDEIDRPVAERDPRNLIVGSLLFQRGLARLVAEDPSAASLEHLDSACLETARAAVKELGHQRDRVRSLTRDPSQVGQKVAMLRICGRALCRVAGCPATMLDSFLERLATGIQILDDVTDVEEDALAGRMSLPFAILECRRGAAVTAIEREDAYAQLTASGALVEALEAANHSLTAALSALAEAPLVATESAARTYLTGLTKAVSHAVETGKDCQSNEGACPGSDDALLRFRQALESIAQQS